MVVDVYLSLSNRKKTVTPTLTPTQGGPVILGRGRMCSESLLAKARQGVLGLVSNRRLPETPM